MVGTSVTKVFGLELSKEGEKKMKKVVVTASVLLLVVVVVYKVCIWDYYKAAIN